MLGKKLGAGVVAGGATLALSVPASASGAVTIGETFAPTAGCTGFTTYLQSTSPASKYMVQTPGVITSWSHEAPASVVPIKFKVGNRVSGDAFQIDAQSGLKTPTPNELNSYTDIRVTVVPGDVIGMFFEAGTPLCGRNVLGYEDHYLSADAAPGPAQTWLFESGLQFDVSATLEPDADGDGFGDETQDGCPGNPLRQDDCTPEADPPETTITKGAPKQTDKTKVKFKFTSDDPNATFECSLKGTGLDHAVKQFGACSSPRKYKRLDEGKHKFKVRAIDAAGNVDPSAAKDKFKVVD